MLILNTFSLLHLLFSFYLQRKGYPSSWINPSNPSLNSIPSHTILNLRTLPHSLIPGILAPPTHPPPRALPHLWSIFTGLLILQKTKKMKVLPPSDASSNALLFFSFLSSPSISGQNLGISISLISSVSCFLFILSSQYKKCTKCSPSLSLPLQSYIYI